MSKQPITTLIIDRGHGTYNSTVKYPTPGKQATLSNGLHVYEGYENEKYCKELARLATLAGYRIEYTVQPSDPTDVSLANRVKFANSLSTKNTSLFISVHNNAGGGKGEGTEIFTSIGETTSDKYAEGMLKELKSNLPNRKLRTDTRDGDLDKEENFYVIQKTSMPAVLLEIGFFDNLTDYEWLSNPTNIHEFSKAIINSITRTNISLCGETKVSQKFI